MIKRGLVVIILFLFLISFICAIEGSFTISSNESEKHETLPSKEQKEQEEKDEKKDCSSNWRCEPEWSECVNFIQTRQCTDLSYCFEESTKSQSRPCIPEAAKEFLGKKTPIIQIPYWAISVIILILIVSLIAFKIFRKKKGKKKTKPKSRRKH